MTTTGDTATGDTDAERVRTAVGRATAQVAAARGLLLSAARELDDTVTAGRTTSDAQRGHRDPRVRC